MLSVDFKLTEKELDLLCEYGSFVVDGYEDCCEEFKTLNLKLLLKREHMKEAIKVVDIDDNINQPKHYISYEIQPIDYINANRMDYLEGNVVKYISRYKLKNGVEDLKKAEFYLRMLIQREGKSTSYNKLGEMNNE